MCVVGCMVVEFVLFETVIDIKVCEYYGANWLIKKNTWKTIRRGGGARNKSDLGDGRLIGKLTQMVV